MTHPPLSKRCLAALAATLLLGFLACVSDRALPNDGPPQGWPEHRGPVIPHDTYPEDCSRCHTDEGWNEIREDFFFDHAAETGYALEGAHAGALCLRCHNDRGPVTLFSQRGCRGCHEDTHLGKNGADCEACHDKQSWRPNERITSHASTRFPLFGAHAAVPCFRCHFGAEVGNFNLTDIECVTCHADALAGAVNPDHQLQGWIDQCDRCHIPTTWGSGGFVHSSAFPLTGAHLQAECLDCHTDGFYPGLPTDCVSCHLEDYNGTTDPPHAAYGFPTDCELCHTPTTWDNAVMDHTGISAPCITCHQDDYDASTDPPHAAWGFPTDCEACHDPDAGWPGANMDHNAVGNDCYTCHQADYNSAQNPVHDPINNPPDACHLCHNPSGW